MLQKSSSCRVWKSFDLSPSLQATLAYLGYNKVEYEAARVVSDTVGGGEAGGINSRVLASNGLHHLGRGARVAGACGCGTVGNGLPSPYSTVRVGLCSRAWGSACLVKRFS